MTRKNIVMAQLLFVASSTLAFADSQQVSQQASGGESPFAIILSLIALAAVGYALVQIKFKSVATQTKSLMPTPISDKEDSLQTKYLRLSKQVNQLTFQMKQLQECVAELREQLTQISALQQKSTSDELVIQSIRKEPEQTLQPVPFKEHHFKLLTKYAETVSADGINQSDLIDSNSEYAYLKIVIDSPVTATFTINDLPAAQAEIISSYDYTIKSLVNRINASSAPKTIVTHKPGRLELQGEKWVLKDKADISLV